MARPKTLRSDISEAVGISVSMVSKYWKRGMPRDSIDGAKSWYMANVGRGKVSVKNFSKMDMVAPSGVKSATPTATEITDELLRGLAFFAASADAKLKYHEAEIQRIKQQVNDMGETLDPEEAKDRLALISMMMAYEKQQNETAKALVTVQDKQHKIELERRESFALKDVEEAVSKLMGGVKQIVDRAAIRITRDLTGDIKAEQTGKVALMVDEIYKSFYEFELIENFRSNKTDN